MKLNKVAIIIGITILSLSLSRVLKPETKAQNYQNDRVLLSQANPTNTSTIFYEQRGIAIKGTDPVAYFTESKPVKGDKKFSYQWGNATWWFKNAENRDLFVKNPTKYAPQYGGFCAWAVSENYTAPIDPSAWTIVEGKLYLNYNKKVQETWSKDIKGNISKGNQNWPSLLAKLRNK